MRGDRVKDYEIVDISATDHTFASKVAAIYCGTAGNVVVRLRGGSADRTIAVQAGSYLYGDFTIVRKTNTTATGLFGVVVQRW
jgi:hypothetical protein